MSLLDSSPFLASLFVTYATGGGVSQTGSEKDELAILQGAYNSLRTAHEKLQREHDLMLVEMELARDEHEAEIDRLKPEQDSSPPNAKPVNLVLQPPNYASSTTPTAHSKGCTTLDEQNNIFLLGSEPSISSKVESRPVLPSVANRATDDVLVEVRWSCRCCQNAEYR